MPRFVPVDPEIADGAPPSRLYSLSFFLCTLSTFSGLVPAPPSIFFRPDFVNFTPVAMSPSPPPRSAPSSSTLPPPFLLTSFPKTPLPPPLGGLLLIFCTSAEHLIGLVAFPQDRSTCAPTLARESSHLLAARYLSSTSIP